MNRQRADEDRDDEHDQVQLAEGEPAEETSVEVIEDGGCDREAAGRPLGHRCRDVLQREDHRQDEDEADRPGDPDRGEDAPRGLSPSVDGLFAEGAGRVEAVDDEHGHERAEREGGQQVPVLGGLSTECLEHDVRRLAVGEEEQDECEDHHSQDLRRDPDVIQEGEQAHPERIDRGRQDQRPDGDVDEPGDAQRTGRAAEEVIGVQGVNAEPHDHGDG